MGKIADLTRAFNAGWANELDSKTAGKLRDAVDSIVANRHQIAHGRDVGITYASIKNYYEDAIRVVEIIQEICGI